MNARVVLRTRIFVPPFPTHIVDPLCGHRRSLGRGPHKGWSFFPQRSEDQSAARLRGGLWITVIPIRMPGMVDEPIDFIPALSAAFGISRAAVGRRPTQYLLFGQRSEPLYCSPSAHVQKMKNRPASLRCAGLF